MNEFGHRITKMTDYCLELLEDKHEEYATEDHFHNFNVAAKLQDTTPEQALVGMMDKHVVSVHDLVRKQAEGADISLDMWREKISDNINYLLILWAMIETKESNNEKLGEIRNGN